MLNLYSRRYIEHPLIRPRTVEYRLYQKRIADIAYTRNTLVILPTALGKTVISAIVAANILYNYRDFKVLVMAPTRPLIIQHRNSFLKILKIRECDVAILTGKIPPSRRGFIWDGEARIFFSTPQVVRNDLIERRLNLEMFGLLVFDECHRAVKEYAYTDIARYYVDQARYPLILGMTASPGSDLKRIMEVCRNLYIERVEFRSEYDPDVKPYIHPVKVEWRRVNLPHEYAWIKTIIRSMLNRRLGWLYEHGIIKRRPEYVTRKNLIEAGEELRYILEESIEEERGQIFTAIMNQSLALTLFHMLELLETQGVYTLRRFLEKIDHERGEKHSYAILTGDPEYETLKAYVEKTKIEHPKAVLLERIVEDQFSRNPSSRIIVFTQYRDTAKYLAEKLNRIPNVKAERFVGQASRLNDKGLTQEEQTERLRMLEDGELNVLVATSIAEEGLDIPAVDHVIFYEPIPSEIRYIQRRGRTGRRAPGRVTILAANESLDMIYLYASRKRTEKMKRIIHDINSKLQTIIRKRQRPPPDPMTEEELKAIDEELIKVKVEPEDLKTETETLKEINREITRISRILYLKLLERGREGATINQILSDMEFEATPANTLRASIDILIKKGLITEVAPGRYAVSSAVKQTGRRVYEIMVERIYPGSAVVRIDGRWRARLDPYDYKGPRELIKKNSRFKAAAELYRMNGRLCIRIKEVTQILD